MKKWRSIEARHLFIRRVFSSGRIPCRFIRIRPAYLSSKSLYAPVRVNVNTITSFFTNIYNTKDCTWNTAMMARETPLYGMNDEIVAFYVAFDNADGTPNGYLVVNASPPNPSVMEYAFATAHNEISVNQTNYYATMGVYLTKDMNARSSDPMLIMNGESFALMSEGSRQNRSSMGRFKCGKYCCKSCPGTKQSSCIKTSYQFRELQS